MSAEDTARALVALPGFRWMPGMRAVYPGHTGSSRRVEVAGTGVAPWVSVNLARPLEDGLPDLTDPATLGCVEHGLLPDAWPPECTIELDIDIKFTGGWLVSLCVWDGSLDTRAFKYSAEGDDRLALVAEALAAALAAAPKGDQS